MRKIYVPILFLFLLSSVNAQAQDQPPFNITHVISVPHLSPGDRNTGLEFTIQNNKDISINNIKIYLFLRFPFSASIPPNNRLGELSYPGYLIGTGGSGDEYTPYFDLGPGTSHRTFFKIDVDRGAKYGTYDIPYTIYYNQNNKYSGKITVAVMGDTLVEITNVSVASNDSLVEPGKIFKIGVSFENIGDNDIKWLRLSLNPKDTELVPLSSASERVFKDITQGSKKDSEFWFSIERGAAIKNYPIDLVLSYMDERGIEYNETKLVGIVSAGRAQLDIARKITEPARVKQNQPFTLTVKIENTGTGDAKGVTARLESELEGDTLAYLGEIKKDDYSNAIFTLDAAKSGKKTGILRISYEDDFGRHEIQKDIDLIINPADTQSPLPAVFGMIAVLIGILLWKRRKPGTL